MASAEEVRDLLAASLSGRLNDAGTILTITSLEVTEHARHFTVTFDVQAPDGRWEVALDGDRSDMHIFDGKPDPALVEQIARMLRVQLFEWWHTKRAERHSAKLGRRIN